MIKKNIIRILCVTLTCIVFSVGVCSEGLIEGYIKDSVGNPLEGVTIEIYEIGNKDIGNKAKLIVSNETDVNGFYVLTLEEGSYDMVFTGGSSSFVYKTTKSDYVRDVLWRSVDVKDNSTTKISFSMNVTPWDFFALIFVVVLCVVFIDQMFLREKILLFEFLIKLRNFFLFFFIKKRRIIEEIEEQKICPISKVNISDIPEGKCYKCLCGTAYHYDAIKPLDKCLNCGRKIA